MAKIITLVCERSCDLSKHLDAKSQLKDMPGCYVVRFPCSGMIQPAMIDAALKNGADGVVVTGCQFGDCYYREGNKMLRERLLGERPPGLKKNVDRRRVRGLWLSRLQTRQLLSELQEFARDLSNLPAAETKATPEAKTAPEVKATPEADVTKAARETAKKTAAPTKAEANEPAEAKPDSPPESN
jgi:coenzyme F420-reducing hydrogenase delta subunit